MTTEEIWPPNIVNRSLIIYPDDNNGGDLPLRYFIFGESTPLILLLGGWGPPSPPPPAPPPVKGLQLLAYDNGFVTCNSV